MNKQLIEQELHCIIQRNDFKFARILLHFALGLDKSLKKESGENQ